MSNDNESMEFFDVFGFPFEGMTRLPAEMVADFKKPANSNNFESVWDAWEYVVTVPKHARPYCLMNRHNGVLDNTLVF